MGINYLMVFIGGALGAVCRFAISLKMENITSTKFPIGTFLINLSGSFLLGLLIAYQPNDHIQLLLGTGFLGGFTTFSTFQIENITLYLEGNYRTATFYLAFS